MVRMLKQRIADDALVGLIVKWLKAGILEEDGKVVHPGSGTPQGGIVSPVLANVYPHYVLDLWFEHKVRRRNRGQSELVRFADDFVCGFAYRHEAEAFLRLLKDACRSLGWKSLRTKPSAAIGRRGGSTTDGSTFWVSSFSGDSVGRAGRWCKGGPRARDCNGVWRASRSGSVAVDTRSCGKPWKPSSKIRAIGINTELGVTPRASSSSINRRDGFCSNG